MLDTIFPARLIRALDLSVLGKEEMFSAGETVKRYWLRQGIKLNRGAFEDELTAFEAEYQVRPPKDLREYFAVVNGFDGSEHWMTDENVITFLALHEMKPLSEVWSPKIADAASCLQITVYRRMFMLSGSRIVLKMITLWLSLTMTRILSK